MSISLGVRESYVNLCSNPDDRLEIYRENFEAAYIQSTEMFYRMKAPEQLANNGVQAYMKYADAKLKEEEARAQRYLEGKCLFCYFFLKIICEIFG